MRYVDAIQARKEAQIEAGVKQLYTKVGVGRRNPGRMDGVKWNGDSFVCAVRVDGDDGDSDSEYKYEWDEDVVVEEKEKRVEISLMDIAKPMKAKGVFPPFPRSFNSS